MCSIPDTTRSHSGSSSFGEDRDLTRSFTGQDAYEEIIKRAESVPLIKIFKHYKISIDSYNRKITCPFKKHKGGRESTASLYFYPETNTFWCFGCKTGLTSVDFVANIEQINKLQAAIKIINCFEQDVNPNNAIQFERDSLEEKTKLLFDFSSKMRSLIIKDPSIMAEIENIYAIFDKMNDKYSLDVPALKSLIDKLNERINKI